MTREALFYGKWIIASDRGAIGDQIDEGVNGFRIDVSTTAGLRAVLTKLNNAPHLYKTPRSSTVLRSADDQAKDLAAVYSEILDETSQVRQDDTAAAAAQ